MKKLSFIILLLSAGAVYAGEVLPKAVKDAICDHSLKKVKSLVNENSSAEIKGNALNVACYCFGGAPEVAEYLLDIGADPDIFKVDKYAYSTLMEALHSTFTPGMKKVVQRIAEKTKNVNFAQKETKETAMHWAAAAGEYGVIKILLERGADPKAKTVAFPGEPSSTPAEYARDNGHVEIALKLEGKNPAAYRTTLHYFAIKGDSAKLKEMIQNGANVNEEEKRSLFTPLYYATRYNHLDAVKTLLEAGANPNKVFPSAGITALREAVVYRFDRVARALIDAGATADHIQTAGCGGGLNEFNWAVEYSQYKLAKYMVEKKAVNQSTSHLFYQRGRNKDIELAELMLKNGLLPSQADIDDAKKDKTTGNEEDKGTLDKLLAMYEKALEGKSVTVKSMKMAVPRKSISESGNLKVSVRKTDEEDDTGSPKMNKSLKRIRTE